MLNRPSATVRILVLKFLVVVDSLACLYSMSKRLVAGKSSHSVGCVKSLIAEAAAVFR